ncbi:protocadherin Fat 4-like [Toxotes jaculatrix]|uniref:protocadherin Fat 4-like n=1 Tax=Toxotes jaculatrix TaxID=941984 RepID=UPI001B3AB76C|nr:protocadherin Fat 4-like [Toxotes jaculatrix]
MAVTDTKGQGLDVWVFFCLALLGVINLEGISAQLRYSIQEELKSGTAVGNVAKDLGLDLGRLAERNLRVVSGTKQDLFEVNPRDGVLFVNQRVDREELCAKTVPCITNLKAVVENPLEMHQVIIEIIDVNDNSPKFPEENYTLEVLESAVVGSRFQMEGAHDLDVGLNSLQSYKLNHNQYFRLETEEFGEDGKVPFLILQRVLDREQSAWHWLLLTATDGGKPSKSGTINITVIVSDINDNSPVCDKQKYTITIRENAPAGTFLLTVNASDSDEGMNGEIEYSLRSKLRGLSSDPFDLDHRTGKLTVKEGLDYEEKQVYEIKVLAADKGAVSLSTHCNVIVRVEDVNDNQPEIEITSLSSRIPEDAPLGTVVALMGVTDLDSGVNGQVVCSVPGHLPFDLKPSPDGQSYSLVTKDYLDKETVHRYDIEITAKDLGSPALSSTKVIQVDVVDVNDNSPLFTESPYTFYVPENNKAGMSIFSVSATDADGGENAAVTYSLDRKSLGPTVTSFLNINEANGTISALKSFDFETMKTFQFHVVASDSGTPSLSSNVTVNVFILDQNDNAPVILYPLSSNGSAEGVEEIPRNVNAGHLVTKVRAYDADIGYNGWLLFSLQEVTDHSLFALDCYTGQIRTLRSFTETDEAEHKLLVLVKDNGNVSLSATATVIVKVVEPKEAFAASDVKTSAKVDEDDNVTFYLMITLGSVSVLFLISIIVLIAMQCSKSTDYTSKYLQETNYDGTLCHSIQYRSGDKRYMFDERLDRCIYFKERRLFFFCFTMGEQGQRRRVNCCWVIGILLLCFGHRILAQLKYSIPEEVKVESPVGNVAKDLGLDTSTLTDRRFRIVSGPNHALFELNQNNGVLYVGKTMDREELCDGTKVCLINLKIVVESPLEIHYVGVEITDVNDHSPTFPEKEQRLEIAEHTPPGTRFQIHAARDPDVGTLSVRLYKLTPNDFFDTEVRDSEEDKIPFLVLKKPLDREQKAEHRLVLTALDGGSPSKSGSLNLTITVLDANDNRPVFSKDTYSVSLDENAPIGTLVIQLNATDLDEGLNSEIEYSFGKTQKKKVHDTFELDSVTGEIRVKGKVDFEETEIYRLDLQASDKGQLPWTAESRVVIKIKDLNDNKPEIEVTSLSNVVPEDSKPGTVISLISVTDRDSGINGNIICKISDNVPFDLTPSIEENMYSLVTKGRLDRETVSHYDITITATDCGEPPLSSAKTLRVQVSDVNDNRPIFSQNPFELYLVENNAPGASIFSVTAVDNDLNENAAITYAVVRGDGLQSDMTSFLNVNSENGQISALKSFDFETLKTFQFHVVASDSGTPSLSSNVTVNVFILDQNDNAPVILYPLSSNGSAEGVEEIPRNVNAGHLVTKVRAYDADIGYNGWLLFSLQEVTDHSLFALDRYTGQIRTLRSFTETDEAEHKLLVLVKDNGNVSLSATATVIVKVVEPKEAFAASDVKTSAKADEDDNVTFYLMITLGSVSVLFLISIIVLIAMQCSKSTDYTSKYLQETNYDGTLCHSIQYRSGDKRYMLVGPRMSIGSTIVPGSHANTLVLPDRRRTSEEVRPCFDVN